MEKGAGKEGKEREWNIKYSHPPPLAGGGKNSRQRIFGGWRNTANHRNLPPPPADSGKYLDKLDSDSVAIGGRRTYFVGSTAEFSWKNLLAPSLTGDQRLQLYRRAVEGMAESGKLGEVFGEMMRGASSPFQNARVLQTFLHAIDELDCDNTENLGDAYEHLLSIMGTQGDAGQFRTPRHIIDFIVAAVAPQKNERRAVSECCALSATME